MKNSWNEPSQLKLRYYNTEAEVRRNIIDDIDKSELMNMSNLTNEQEGLDRHNEKTYKKINPFRTENVLSCIKDVDHASRETSAKETGNSFSKKSYSSHVQFTKSNKHFREDESDFEHSRDK